MEIDLVRKGRRIPMQKPLPASPYFIFVGRSNKRPVLDVWPIGFRDRLPEVPVPLLAADADVELDLQGALNDVYRNLRLEQIIDYSQPPEPPLPASELSWAKQIVRAAKPRK